MEKIFFFFLKKISFLGNKIYSFISFSKVPFLGSPVYAFCFPKIQFPEALRSQPFGATGVAPSMNRPMFISAASVAATPGDATLGTVRPTAVRAARDTRTVWSKLSCRTSSQRDSMMFNVVISNFEFRIEDASLTSSSGIMSKIFSPINSAHQCESSHQISFA